MKLGAQIPVMVQRRNFATHKHGVSSSDIWIVSIFGDVVSSGSSIHFGDVVFANDIWIIFVWMIFIERHLDIKKNVDDQVVPR